jgi:hypothetical protein
VNQRLDKLSVSDIYGERHLMMIMTLGDDHEDGDDDRQKYRFTHYISEKNNMIMKFHSTAQGRV